MLFCLPLSEQISPIFWRVSNQGKLTTMPTVARPGSSPLPPPGLRWSLSTMFSSLETRERSKMSRRMLTMIRLLRTQYLCPFIPFTVVNLSWLVSISDHSLCCPLQIVLRSSEMFYQCFVLLVSATVDSLNYNLSCAPSKWCFMRINVVLLSFYECLLIFLSVIICMNVTFSCKYWNMFYFLQSAKNKFMKRSTLVSSVSLREISRQFPSFSLQYNCTNQSLCLYCRIT